MDRAGVCRKRLPTSSLPPQRNSDCQPFTLPHTMICTLHVPPAEGPRGHQVGPYSTNAEVAVKTFLKIVPADSRGRSWTIENGHLKAPRRDRVRQGTRILAGADRCPGSAAGRKRYGSPVLHRRTRSFDVTTRLSDANDHLVRGPAQRPRQPSSDGSPD